MDRLSIEHLSVFGLPPVEFVNLTADLGCQHMSIALSPIVEFNPHGYPTFSLKEDRALRREMLATMRDRGVSISLGSGFILQPNTDVSAYAADLDALSALGVKRVNTITMDREVMRGFDNLGRLAELAAAFGMGTTVELVPGLLVGDLPSALTAIRHVGQRDFRLLIDTMHLVRAGASAADVAALDSELIGYIQLCDAPLVSKHASYADEVTFQRMVPGTGELPLLDIMAALPRDLVIGLEVPLRSQAEAGIGPYDRLRPCVKAAREILSRIDDRPH